MKTTCVLKIDHDVYRFLEENWWILKNTLTVSTGGISAMFSRAFPDLGEISENIYRLLVFIERQYA
jgi:hypothetical protein